MVICSELPTNEGSSVTYSAGQIAAEVIRYHRLPAPVWIEHYPTEATDGRAETFELVVFSSYEVKERAPYLGETRLTMILATSLAKKRQRKQTVNEDGPPLRLACEHRDANIDGPDYSGACLTRPRVLA